MRTVPHGCPDFANGLHRDEFDFVEIRKLERVYVRPKKLALRKITFDEVACL